MDFHQKHMDLLDAANYAKSEIERRLAREKLYGWREGLMDAGIRFSICDADLEYEARGIDRPMCAGLFLDWVPSEL